MTPGLRDLLALGTKFIPTPQPAHAATLAGDFNTFERRVRLSLQFRSAPNTNFLPKFHIPNPTWVPAQPSAPFRLWLDQTKALFSQLTSQPLPAYRLNLTPSQRLTLHSLRTNPDIIVKPADKNLGPCIMDRSWYEGELRRQLIDEGALTYKMLGRDAPPPTESIHSELVSLFSAARRADLIDERILRYIQKRTPPAASQLPRFYLLPKVHKPKVAGRPIVPGHSWVTTPASVWVDSVLQPHFARHMPTLCTSSTQLIRELQYLPPIRSNCKFITADVASLYTNIPIGQGIAFVRTFMRDTGAFNAAYIDFVAKVLDKVLTNNYFTAAFDDAEFTFLQLTGTAMGTPAAVAFANIYMYVLERSVVQRYKAAGTLLYYCRYIDDIFAIVSDDGTALMNSLSAMQPRAIKLDFKTSNQGVDFLDLHIFKGPDFTRTGRLSTSVHQKAMNTYLYIPFSSFHSPRAKGAFIITELMRYIRNCSDFSDYIAMKKSFFRRLRARGYPPLFIQHFFSKVQYSQRSHLLRPRPPAAPVMNEDVFFTCQYDPRTSRMPLKRILSAFLPSRQVQPQVGFRRTANLLGKLAQSSATPESGPAPKRPRLGDS